MKRMSIFVAVFFFSVGLFAQNGKGLSAKQLGAIEQVMAPLRTQVEAQLKKTDAKLFAAYQSDLKKAMAITDPGKQKVALAAFDSKYYAFVKKGYDAAKVDEAGAKSKITALLKGVDYKISFTAFLGITGTYQTGTAAEAPNPCMEFACPFSVTNTTMSLNFNTGGGAFGSSNCTARTGTTGVLAAGRGEFSAGGECATGGANRSRVDVSSQFNYSVSGFAGACIGGSYSDASVGITVTGPGVNKRVEHVAGWAVAPVIWYNAFEKKGTNDRMQTNFKPASGGGD